MAKVFLRSLASEDVEVTHKWHSDISLFETLVGAFRYVSIEAEKEWLQSKAKYSNEEINLMICLEESHQPIGLISVREIDWITRTGYLAGILIGDPEYRGKGYGTEALKLMIQHCFEDLGLNKIWTLILDTNEPSIRTFKKCGFEVEGNLRQHAFKGEKFRDVVLFGLLANHYSKFEQ